MSEDEFNMFIDSEKIAYRIYNNMVLNNYKEQSVDYIFEFYGINSYYNDLKFPTYYKVYELLKNEYNTDMLNLKFRDTKEKEKLINYINYINADKDIDNSIKI